MALSEFDIIETYFASRTVCRDDVKLGIGDDAAVMSIPDGLELVVAMDTLVDGVHFPANTPAEHIAWKALAVNLSDLAAMGAEPAWFTLALTMPASDQEWLKAFSKGLFSLADRYHMQLVGGDTTRGPLSITIQVAGYVPAGTALTRNGAKPGDVIYVSGTVGDAALGLKHLQGNETGSHTAYLIERLQRPTPRTEIGQALSGLASACIDVSDGLYADLGHILESSHVGARLQLEDIPLADEFRQTIAETEQQQLLALTGGDDYELCFSIPPDSVAELKGIANQYSCPLTRIGEIVQAPGIRMFRQQQQIEMSSIKSGYRHF